MIIIEIVVLLALIAGALWLIVIGIGSLLAPKIKRFNEYNKALEDFSEEANKTLKKEEITKLQEVLNKLKKK